jgi:hypothetical protein
VGTGHVDIPYGRIAARFADMYYPEVGDRVALRRGPLAGQQGSVLRRRGIGAQVQLDSGQFVTAESSGLKLLVRAKAAPETNPAAGGPTR